MASKSSLAVRLRSERSRSRTPEHLGTPPRLNGETKSETPSPSRLAGTKRKAGDDGASAVKIEDAPQAKRVAT